MPDIKDGEQLEVQGSGKKPYILKNIGGVYSCSCPAWRNQSAPINIRTCKHLKKLRGLEAEMARVGIEAKTTPVKNSEPKPSAPPVMLAHKWDGIQDISGWWASEKLDGVRAWWTGTEFLSRLGNKIYAPKWFIEGLPNVGLDGELWLGRGKFQETVSIVRRQDEPDTWKEIRFWVFDIPTSQKLFEARLEEIPQVLENHLYSNMVVHKLVKNNAHLAELLKDIEELGGEGVMLRAPFSPYEEGRSNLLLKVKSFLDDEGTVYGYQPGRGKHKGKCGALLVRTDNGKEFKVGTGLSDKERESPPEIGSRIIYRYFELTQDQIPRFPSYIGIRNYE